MRSWIINSYFGEENIPEEEKDYPLVNAEYRAFKDKNFCTLFGCPKNTKKVAFSNGTPQKQKEDKLKYETAENTALNTESKGKIIFFDSFPTTVPHVVPEIMNNHYRDYYDNHSLPTDTQSPNPIFFMSVKDTSFLFIAGSVNKNTENLTIGGKNLSQWLKSALTNHGIGAKTAVGYGYMQSS